VPEFSNSTVLLIIDVQKGFADQKWGRRNNVDAEKNIVKLLQLWRQTGRPVVHIKHNSTESDSPLRPGQPGNEFRSEVAPADGEHVESKTVNSAFIGTGLEQYLRKNGYHSLVIVGLTTNHCVSTSTRMSGNLGFTTYVVSDATATFNRLGPDGREFTAEEIHACELSNLQGEFATVVTTDEVLAACSAAAV
jgi:nicotinamidase-related amidase